MSKFIKITISLFLCALLLIGGIFYIRNSKKEAIVPPSNFHASMYYYDNVDFFPQLVQAFKNIKPLSPPPHVFIVNQHILAARPIAQQFALSADEKVKTVVVITQNNRNAGNSPIITSLYDWKTPLGNIETENDIVHTLVNKKLASVEEDIFTKEHGITSIVPYVAHSFPNAKIVTLVLRDDTPDGLVDALAHELSGLDRTLTAVIGIIDMSHHLPKYIADAHDRLTIQSIKKFDYDTLPRLDIDTVPTLRTIMKVAEDLGYTSFIQTEGTHTADSANDPHLMVTTSYSTGYFQPRTVEDLTDTIHMLFVGDIMLDRGVALHAQKNGVDSLLSKIDRLFLGTHAVIGNLEGSITNYESISSKDHSILRFTFDPEYATFLKKFNFSVLSLANNHALDFGEDGYNQTTNHLRNNGLVYFGSPLNNKNISSQIVIHGKKICFVGYHDLFIPDPSLAINEIKNIRSDCSYVVVFTHWGVEYLHTMTERQKMLARSFIDAGADLVIGAHPHVVEPLEVYNNKAIFYSLGNFIFDQNFSFETEHGLAVNVEWDDAKTLFTLIPIGIEKGEVSLAPDGDAQKIIAMVVATDALSGDISSAILNSKQFTLWNNHKN